MAKCINHSAHPHPLELHEGTECEFRCGLSWCRGFGSYYRSPSCDFRVHDTCAAYPETLTFFGHPQHPLALHPVVVGSSCDLCRFSIRGIHYGCRLCGVFLHPVCVILPPAALSPVHPQRLVMLIPASTGGGAWKKCASCDDRDFYGSVDNLGWRYVCAPCGVRLHPWCLLGDGGDKDEGAPLCIRGLP